MAYPCGLPEFHSWNSQGKLDDLHFQSHLQTSTGQSDSDVLPVRMTEHAIKTGDSFATLFSPFHTGAAWKQILGAQHGEPRLYKSNTVWSYPEERPPGAHASSTLICTVAADSAEGTGSSSRLEWPAKTTLQGTALHVPHSA